VTSAVRTVLDACAAAGADTSPGCPFDADAIPIEGTVENVSWSITKYPSVTVPGSDPNSMASSEGTVAFSFTGGVVHYQVSYTDFFDESVQQTSGDLDVEGDGWATPSGTGVTASLE
jgi:hypothetical protein